MTRSPLPPSQTCAADHQCLSNRCISGRCSIGVTCVNNIKDSLETDVDCGGFSTGCFACCYGERAGAASPQPASCLGASTTRAPRIAQPQGRRAISTTTASRAAARPASAQRQISAQPGSTLRRSAVTSTSSARGCPRARCSCARGCRCTRRSSSSAGSAYARTAR
jgi:hypothetical protein